MVEEYYESRWSGEEIDKLLQRGNFVVSGTYPNEAAIKAAFPNGADGGAYQAEDTRDLYVWNTATSEWENIGQIEGPQGIQGVSPVVSVAKANTGYNINISDIEGDKSYPVPGGAPRTVRFVVGTSAAGWTEQDCDYLCDGIDDQEEINAAITALPEDGGEIVILDGVYNITSAIQVQRYNVALIGLENTEISWVGVSSSTAWCIIMYESCKVTGLKLTAPALVQNKGVVLRRYVGSHSSEALKTVISNCEIQNYSMGISIECSVARDKCMYYIQKNSVFMCTNGICFTRLNNTQVYKLNNIFITDNFIYSNTNNGIYAPDATASSATVIATLTNLHIANNIITSNKNGMYIACLSIHCNITSNIITNNTQYGIYVSRASNMKYISSWNISDNTISKNTNSQIYVQYSWCNITNNLLQGTDDKTSNGIYLTGEYGVGLNLNPTINICNNTAECCSYCVYISTSSNATIVNNLFKYSNNGVSVFNVNKRTGDTYISAAKLINNIFIENTKGILVSTSSLCRIVANTIQDSDCGIELTGKLTNNYVASNIIYRGTGGESSYSENQYTIYVHTSGASEISDNVFAYNLLLGKDYVSNADSTNVFIGNVTGLEEA